MTGEIKYRFELRGRETNNLHGSMLAEPQGCDDIEVAYKVNKFYDRVQEFLKTSQNLTESLRVEYVPDPVVLRVVPDNE